jgi:acyl-CoA synthetase (AMP-forming)/AMP-acid ligase II
MATERKITVGLPGGSLAAPVIPDVTVPEFVLGEAQLHGGKRALVDVSSGRELTYAEFARAVEEGGSWLAAQGVRAGDVLALCSPNSIEFVLTWYATSSIGAVVTTVNPMSQDAEIVHQLRRSRARWLVTTGELFTLKFDAAARDSAIKQTFLIGAGVWDGPGVTPLGQQPCPDSEATAPRAGLSASDVAMLAPSSGTSGLPKLVVLTHRNMVANLCQMETSKLVTENDVVIAALPLFHILGLQVSMHLTLLRGATLVILPRFELGSFLHAIQNYAATTATVVPPMLVALAKSEMVDDYDVSSLRVLTSAAAPLGAELAHECAQRLGCRIRQGYGLTELAGGTHAAPEDGPDRPESIGPAMPGVECRVIDPETGADLSPGQAGELLLRAASTMTGYLGDPEATSQTIDADGWVHTGDIVTADPGGWFRVTDRIKELIKYNGYQVAPAQLEEILLAHSAVADAAVVRSPDERAGEVPKAFIVLQAPASADELMEWVADRVAPYKRVRRVEFIDEIPKSASGKILRRLLAERERAAQDGDLTGTVVLVSGGSRGLGRLLAGRLARAGAAVALVARSGDELAAAVDEIKRGGGTAASAIADVTDQQALEAAIAQLHQQLGPVDVLINNAGVIGPAGPTWELDPTSWWHTFEVNLGGAFALTSAVLPDMIAAGHGTIINVTSNAGVYRWPLVSAYATSKAALVKLTENLAAETRSHGISVLSVDPGLLPLGLTQPSMNKTPDPDEPSDIPTAWVQDQLAAGHGADPDQATRLITRLAAGHGDRLSGRHLQVTDDLDHLLTRTDEIKHEDLYTLRLRTAGAAYPGRCGAGAGREPDAQQQRSGGSSRCGQPTSRASSLSRPAPAGEQPVTTPEIMTRTGQADWMLMTAIHDALRRDLDQLLQGTVSRAAARTRWAIFCGQLRFHLTTEEAVMWRPARARLAGDPGGLALLDAMQDEHRLISPLQAVTDDAFIMDADPGRLRQLLTRLRTRLTSHLAHEESDALPLISQIMTRRELAAIGRAVRGGTGAWHPGATVPWALTGATPGVCQQVRSQLPAPTRLLYRTLWLPRYMRRTRPL